MIKIFNCSNSKERPSSRKLGGPFINEFVQMLMKYGHLFDVSFVNNINESDVLFTNDIFPSYLLKINKPKIKRMDGVFWQQNLHNRNIPFIEACYISDHVIFITNYSKKSFETFYNINEIKKYSTITHWVDSGFDIPAKKFNGIFYSMATNWSRSEKRLNEIIRFAKIYPQYKINLIGTCDSSLPSNIIKHDYLKTDSIEFKNILVESSVFLNLTCKDAATKTVCTSINSNIPVLYSGSGGVSEIVKEHGIKIYEEDSIEILDYIPELNEKDIINGTEKIIEQYDEISSKLSISKKYLLESVNSYCEIFKQYS